MSMGQWTPHGLHKVEDDGRLYCPNAALFPLRRAADRSIEDCACKATSAHLIWAGDYKNGWWVTVHILANAIVHAIASYPGDQAGSWVAGKGAEA